MAWTPEEGELIPHIATCGYAVDFLRSCYSAQFRCFKDRPELLTKGRFFFVASDTPVVPYPSAFVSRNYTRQERADNPPLLGEVLDEPRRYTDGRGPTRRPRVTLCATAAQLIEGDDGEPVPEPANNKGVIDCCYLNPDPCPDDFEGYDFSDPTTVFYFCRALKMLAYCSHVRAIEAFKLLFCDSVVTTFFPATNVNSFPFAVVQLEAFTAVFSEGTATTGQLYDQFEQATAGAIDYGQFSSIPIWKAHADRVGLALSGLGVTASTPILLVGHSGGMAGLNVLAALLHLANVDRRIRLLSFAAPKAGDQRLANIVAGLGITRWVNLDDPVPWVPPSLYWLIPLTPFFILPWLLRWGAFRHPGLANEVDPEGNVARGVTEPGDFELLLDFLLAAVVTGDIFDPPQHLISEYVHRLALAAGLPVQDEDIDIPIDPCLQCEVAPFLVTVTAFDPAAWMALNDGISCGRTIPPGDLCQWVDVGFVDAIFIPGDTIEVVLEFRQEDDYPEQFRVYFQIIGQPSSTSYARYEGPRMRCDCMTARTLPRVQVEPGYEALLPSWVDLLPTI